MEELISVESLGPVLIRWNQRARRISCRARDGIIVATVPVSCTLPMVREAILRMRPQLEDLLSRAPEPAFIAPDSLPKIPGMKIVLTQSVFPSFQAQLQSRTLLIYYPSGTDFTLPQSQGYLTSVVIKGMVRVALMEFAPRLEALAKRHGLSYSGLTISSAMARWGSCSSQRRISLSCYLLLVPARLQDFVMLHELAHIRHMNHGTGFHDLLEKLTEGRMKQLEQELKAYRPGLWR